MSTLIVGGGIAGLRPLTSSSAAASPFVVLEARSRAGGVILSEQIDGFTIDAGPDALLVQKPDGITLCEELGLGDRLVPTKPPRLAYIQRDGRLHPLPAASVLGIPTAWCAVSPHVAVLVARQAAHGRGARIVPARRDDEDESIGAFMARRFGDRSQGRIWPSRCSPASTRATSIGCRSARCFPASARPSGRTGVCSWVSQGSNVARATVGRTATPAASFDRLPED